MTDSAYRYVSLRVAPLRVATRRENPRCLRSSSKSLPVGAHNAAGHVDRGLSFGAVQGSEEDCIVGIEAGVGMDLVDLGYKLQRDAEDGVFAP